MLTGEETFVLSTGTVAKVRWERPEVGVDITEEEYQRRLQNIADTALRVYSNQCRRMLARGEDKEAEELWRSIFRSEPFWLKEEKKSDER